MSLSLISRYTQNLAMVITMAINSHPEIHLNKIVKTELIQCASTSLNNIAQHIELMENENIKMVNKIKKLEEEIAIMKKTKCKNNWPSYY